MHPSVALSISTMLWKNCFYQVLNIFFIPTGRQIPLLNRCFLFFLWSVATAHLHSKALGFPTVYFTHTDSYLVGLPDFTSAECSQWSPCADMYGHLQVFQTDRYYIVRNTTFHLFIGPLMNIWAVFAFWLLWMGHPWICVVYTWVSAEYCFPLRLSTCF